jgi:hypothetical protein
MISGMENMERKRSGWGQLNTAEFRALDEERVALASARQLLRESAKAIGATYEPISDDPRKVEPLAVRLLTGDPELFRSRAANVVGRVNEDLEREGKKTRLTYSGVGDTIRIAPAE